MAIKNEIDIHSDGLALIPDVKEMPVAVDVLDKLKPSIEYRLQQYKDVVLIDPEEMKDDDLTLYKQQRRKINSTINRVKEVRTAYTRPINDFKNQFITKENELVLELKDLSNKFSTKINGKVRIDNQAKRKIEEAKQDKFEDFMGPAYSLKDEVLEVMERIKKLIEEEDYQLILRYINR